MLTPFSEPDRLLESDLVEAVFRSPSCGDEDDADNPPTDPFVKAGDDDDARILVDAAFVTPIEAPDAVNDVVADLGLKVPDAGLPPPSAWSRARSSSDFSK